jgi:UPF0755 protein
MNTKQLLGAVSATIIKIVLAAAVIVVVFRLAVYSYNFGFQVFADIPVSSGEGRTVNVVVDEGLSDMELAKLLEQKGIIRDVNVFYVQVKLSEYKDDIKPGTYELSTAMNSEEILTVLSGAEEDQEEQE